MTTKNTLQNNTLHDIRDVLDSKGIYGVFSGVIHGFNIRIKKSRKAVVQDFLHGEVEANSRLGRA